MSNDQTISLEVLDSLIPTISGSTNLISETPVSIDPIELSVDPLFPSVSSSLTTIIPTGREIGLYCDGSVTIDSDESSIIFNALADSKIYFESYSKTYADISIDPSEGTSFFYGNNLFNSLSIIGDGAINFNIESGETTQIITSESGLTLTGATAGGLRLDRIGIGSWSISMSSGTVNATNCTISNSTATGGATFNALVANGNIDGGGNTGWNF